MPAWFKDWWPIIVVIVPALWAAWIYFDKRRREDRNGAKPAPAAPDQSRVTASRGGVAAGGDMRGNVITTNRSPGESDS